MRSLYLTWIPIILLGCTKSEEENTKQSSKELPTVSVIAHNFDQAYLDSPSELYFYKTGTAGELMQSNDINNGLNISPDYTYLSKDGEKYTFFYRDYAVNNFSLVEYYPGSGSTISFETICTTPENNSVPLNLEPKASQEKSILITTEQIEGITNYYANIMAGDQSCNRLLIGQAVNPVNNFHLQVVGELLYFYYPEENSDGTLVQVDLTSGSVANEIQLERPFKGIIAPNEIHIYRDEGLHFSMDAKDFSIGTAPSWTGNYYRSLPPGFSESQILNPEQALIKYYDSYPQPGAISNGPAILDLTNLEITAGKSAIMYDFWRHISENSPGSIHITDYTYDPGTNIIVVGYEERTVEEATGGLLYGDFDGKIYSMTPLETTPQALWIE